MTTLSTVQWIDLQSFVNVLSNMGLQKATKSEVSEDGTVTLVNGDWSIDMTFQDGLLDFDYLITPFEIRVPTGSVCQWNGVTLTESDLYDSEDSVDIYVLDTLDETGVLIVDAGVFGVNEYDVIPSIGFSEEFSVDEEILNGVEENLLSSINELNDVVIDGDKYVIAETLAKYSDKTKEDFNDLALELIANRKIGNSFVEYTEVNYTIKDLTATVQSADSICVSATIDTSFKIGESKYSDEKGLDSSFILSMKDGKWVISEIKDYSFLLLNARLGGVKDEKENWD